MNPTINDIGVNTITYTYTSSSGCYNSLINNTKISVKVIAPEFANETLILTGHHRMRLYELMEMINEIMGNTLEIQYGSGNESHYHYTPYSFTPRAGKKIVMNTYNDLGESLLQDRQQQH